MGWGSEEIGARARSELASGIGAKRGRFGLGALARGREGLAAVGLHDQAAEIQPAGRDRGMARDRGLARAVEHLEECALGRKRGCGLGMIDRGVIYIRAEVL